MAITYQNNANARYYDPQILYLCHTFRELKTLCKQVKKLGWKWHAPQYSTYAMLEEQFNRLGPTYLILTQSKQIFDSSKRGWDKLTLDEDVLLIKDAPPSQEELVVDLTTLMLTQSTEN